MKTVDSLCLSLRVRLLHEGGEKQAKLGWGTVVCTNGKLRACPALRHKTTRVRKKTKTARTKATLCAPPPIETYVRAATHLKCLLQAQARDEASTSLSPFHPPLTPPTPPVFPLISCAPGVVSHLQHVHASQERESSERQRAEQHLYFRAETNAVSCRVVSCRVGFVDWTAGGEGGR